MCLCAFVSSKDALTCRLRKVRCSLATWGNHAMLAGIQASLDVLIMSNQPRHTSRACLRAVTFWSCWVLPSRSVSAWISSRSNRVTSA